MDLNFHTPVHLHGLVLRPETHLYVLVSQISNERLSIAGPHRCGRLRLRGVPVGVLGTSTVVMGATTHLISLLVPVSVLSVVVPAVY